MKFFKKYGVAITILVLAIVLSLAFGQLHKTQQPYTPDSASAAQDWAKEHASEYEKFISDETGTLSTSEITKLSEYDAALDYRYGSIVGIKITDAYDGGSIVDAAYDAGYDLGLGESDLSILIVTGDQEWYAVPGDDLADYVDNELEILFRQSLTDDIYTSKAGKQLLTLMNGLSDWYGKNLPQKQTAGSGESRGDSIMAVLIILVVLIVIVALISSIGRRSYGGPVFFFGRPRPWFHHHHHMPPPPPPGGPMGGGPRPGPGGPGMGGRPGGASRPSSPPRSSGGFGSSTRGSSFGGSSRGGSFGGGSRSGGSRSGGFGGGSRGGSFGGSSRGGGGFGSGRR